MQHGKPSRGEGGKRREETGREGGRERERERETERVESSCGSCRTRRAPRALSLLPASLSRSPSLSFSYSLSPSSSPLSRRIGRKRETNRRRERTAFCSGSSTVLPRTQRSSRSHLSSLLHALARANECMLVGVCVCVCARICTRMCARVYVCVHRQSADTRFRRGEERGGPIDFHRVSKFSMHISPERGANASLYMLPSLPFLSLRPASLVNSDWIYSFARRKGSAAAFDRSPGYG